MNPAHVEAVKSLKNAVGNKAFFLREKWTSLISHVSLGSGGGFARLEPEHHQENLIHELQMGI
jgi:hypothetical protein